MKAPLSTDQRIARMSFASVYPHYVAKVRRKGRSEEELHAVIQWLTGFDSNQLEALLHEQVSFDTFFERATLPAQAALIKGTICGQRIEEISTDLTRKVRYLDKLVDELAKGRKLEKILNRG